MKGMFLFLIVFFYQCSETYAEIDNVCWTSPTVRVIADFKNAKFSTNKAGAIGVVNYSSVPSTFNGICNRIVTGNYIDMTHYIDMGVGIVPSMINPGWYQLSEDIDIKISPSGTSKFVPFGPEAQLIGVVTPPYSCSECVVPGFSVASNGVVHIILRRDVIGGAIYFPPNVNLFKAYRVGNFRPYPIKPSQSMVELYTSPNGTVIPIPNECEINNGGIISVDFGIIPGNYISQLGLLDGVSIDKLLTIGCKTSLTQDATVRLVSGVASFSNELIMTNKSGLGIALKHNGKLIKPNDRFPIRLIGGRGKETITFIPVNNPASVQQLGFFTASATLIIESL